MYCLYNGEYGEHDLSWCPALETTLRIQEEQYKQYKGVVVGDFTCINVEYDWGRRDQRWKVKCIHCGEEQYIYHAKDWKRGKGRKITCDCRKSEEIAAKAKEVEEREEQRRVDKEIRLQQVKDKYIGKVFYGWEITDCVSENACHVRCASCGKELKSAKSINKLISGQETECKHPTDYSGEEWIGKKIGHLTVTGRQGKYFIYRCDCGNERISSPSLAFRVKAITNCGRSDCPYMDDIHKGVAKTKEIGQQYEHDILSRLLMQGYNAKTTVGNGDYGVDILVDCDDGSRMAIQCKYHKSIVGVEAVQAVYAGGRFYDCTKFAVVSNSGFSNNAVIMAKKLGVYLSDGNFEYPSDIQEYSIELLPTIKIDDSNTKAYKIDDEIHTFADWCSIFHKSEEYVRSEMRKHKSLKSILIKDETSRKQIYTAFGESGTITEFSRKYKISAQLIRYRINQRNMSLEEALTIPKQNNKRQK